MKTTLKIIATNLAGSLRVGILLAGVVVFATPCPSRGAVLVLEWNFGEQGAAGAAGGTDAGVAVDEAAADWAEAGDATASDPAIAEGANGASSGQSNSSSGGGGSAGGPSTDNGSSNNDSSKTDNSPESPAGLPTPPESEGGPTALPASPEEFNETNSQSPFPAALEPTLPPPGDLFDGLTDTPDSSPASPPNEETSWSEPIAAAQLPKFDEGSNVDTVPEESAAEEWFHGSAAASGNSFDTAPEFASQVESEAPEATSLIIWGVLATSFGVAVRRHQAKLRRETT